MKELKFKAWHKVEKRLFDVYGFNRDFVFEDSYDSLDNTVHERENIELLQFTGKKDSKGVEYFEGHITKINMCFKNIIGIDADCIGKDAEGEALYKVIFLENLSQFCLELISWTKFKPRNKYLHLYSGMIRGNIYENPELLEQK